MFTSDTARMQAARVAELQELSTNDAIPSEMVGGETTRIDATHLTDLIEISAGIAVGTPKRGLPQLDDPEIEVVLARGSSPGVEVEAVAVAPAKSSRLRDALIGGAISIVAMAAWYCATQL